MFKLMLLVIAAAMVFAAPTFAKPQVLLDYGYYAPGYVAGYSAGYSAPYTYSYPYAYAYSYPLAYY